MTPPVLVLLLACEWAAGSGGPGAALCEALAKDPLLDPATRAVAGASVGGPDGGSVCRDDRRGFVQVRAAPKADEAHVTVTRCPPPVPTPAPAITVEKEWPITNPQAVAAWIASVLQPESIELEPVAAPTLPTLPAPPAPIAAETPPTPAPIVTAPATPTPVVQAEAVAPVRTSVAVEVGAGIVATGFPVRGLYQGGVVGSVTVVGPTVATGRGTWLFAATGRFGFAPTGVEPATPLAFDTTLNMQRGAVTLGAGWAREWAVSKRGSARWGAVGFRLHAGPWLDFETARLERTLTGGAVATSTSTVTNPGAYVTAGVQLRLTQGFWIGFDVMNAVGFLPADFVRDDLPGAPAGATLLRLHPWALDAALSIGVHLE